MFLLISSDESANSASLEVTPNSTSFILRAIMGMWMRGEVVCYENEGRGGYWNTGKYYVLWRFSIYEEESRVEEVSPMRQSVGT